MLAETVLEFSAVNMTQVRERVVAEITKAWHLRGKPNGVKVMIPMNLLGIQNGTHEAMQKSIATLENWALRQRFSNGFALKASDMSKKCMLKLN